MNWNVRATSAAAVVLVAILLSITGCSSATSGSPAGASVSSQTPNVSTNTGSSSSVAPVSTSSATPVASAPCDLITEKDAERVLDASGLAHQAQHDRQTSTCFYGLPENSDRLAAPTGFLLKLETGYASLDAARKSASIRLVQEIDGHGLTSTQVDGLGPGAVFLYSQSSDTTDSGKTVAFQNYAVAWQASNGGQYLSVEASSTWDAARDHVIAEARRIYQIESSAP